MRVLVSALLLLSVLPAAPLPAQVLRARLLDAATSTPISGAFATLRPVNRPGGVSGLTGGGGWVELSAPGPGRCRDARGGVQAETRYDVERDADHR